MMLALALVLATSPSSDLLERLAQASRAGPFFFGQENATLSGMALDGAVITSDVWLERTARAEKWTSDAAQIAGADPAVLGIGLDMLAFEPLAWNRRDLVAQAMRRHLAAGGIVTVDWHAESCEADVVPQGLAGTVSVEGQEVPIAAKSGGLFYAEDEYTHAIHSRSDVPASLTCLCKIANALPLRSGLPARTWLQARAIHIATVLREQGLSGAPLIVRSFHEQNGEWFWWGRPFWNCAALLQQPHAISGASAYKAMARDFIATLRAEPGMENLVFAFSPAAIPAKREHLSASERRLADPSALAHDILRRRLVAELAALGLSYRGKSTGYREGYPGDDVIGLEGLDVYYPRWRPANARDAQQLSLALHMLRDTAHGKPYALTEVGTLRLPLIERLSRGQPASSESEVAAAAALFFDPHDRRRFLQSLGLAEPAALTATPLHAEHWFTTQLLPAARDAHVAYALVWQDYNANGTATYFVPPPGHPDADDFAQFAKSAALLRH